MPSLVRLLVFAALCLALAPLPARAQDTRPLAVGDGHGWDPGAKRKGEPPIDDAALHAPEATPGPPRVITHGPRDAKRIALTFDGCPSKVEHGGFRRDIVEFLRAEHVPATFFLSSRWSVWRPEVVRELARDPLFEVESHGGGHVDMRRHDRGKMRKELSRAQAVLHHLTGRAPRHFRPPRGAWNQALAEEAGRLGLSVLLFDVVSADAEASFSADRIARNVLSGAKPGSIVVLHVNGPAKHTLEALPKIVSGLREQGYELVRLSQLLGEDTTVRDEAWVRGEPLEGDDAMAAEALGAGPTAESMSYWQ